MGYRGKVEEQEAARDLRRAGWTVPDIARKLAVARSSVSSWVRDIPLPEAHSRRIRADRPNRLRDEKNAEIDRLLADGRHRIGSLTEREFLVAGAALYAGEGSKTDGQVHFTNSDPRLIVFFCAWLRAHFSVDESRLRVRIYLHEGLDLDAAVAFWSQLIGVPVTQFVKPHRPAARATRRTNRHPHGCVAVWYCCSRTHRAVMGLVAALLSCCDPLSGVAQSAERRTVNPQVLGSSPSPGA